MIRSLMLPTAGAWGEIGLVTLRTHPDRAVATLKALFQGRRDLFRGLAIEKTDWDWENEVYPVLHLDMSVVASRTADELEISLQDLIEGLSAAFMAPFNPAKPAKTNFKNLLEALPRVAVRKDEKAIYVVEFKYAKSAEAALAQCRERRYADAYAADGRRIVYVGVNYDPAARTFNDVRTEAAR